MSNQKTKAMQSIAVTSKRNQIQCNKKTRENCIYFEKFHNEDTTGKTQKKLININTSLPYNFSCLSHTLATEMLTSTSCVILIRL